MSGRHPRMYFCRDPVKNSCRNPWRNSGSKSEKTLNGISGETPIECLRKNSGLVLPTLIKDRNPLSRLPFMLTCKNVYQIQRLQFRSNCLDFLFLLDSVSQFPTQATPRPANRGVVFADMKCGVLVVGFFV